MICNTNIRGTDLATNLEFHYGLVNWFIGRNVMAKPTTRFVVPYLALVGLLKEEASKIDPVFAFFQMKSNTPSSLMAMPNSPGVTQRSSTAKGR